MPSSKFQLVQLLVGEADALQRFDPSRDYAQAIEDAWILLSEALAITSSDGARALRGYVQYQRARAAMASNQGLSSLEDRQMEGLLASQDALTLYSPDTDRDTYLNLLRFASEFARRLGDHAACIAFTESAIECATKVGGSVFFHTVLQAARQHLRCNVPGGGTTRARALLEEIKEGVEKTTWAEQYSFWNGVYNLEMDSSNWEAAINAARRACWITRRNSAEDFADALSALGGFLERLRHHARALRVFKRAIAAGKEAWSNAAGLASQDPLGIITSQLYTLSTYQSRFYLGAATQCHKMGRHEEEFRFLREGSARTSMAVLNAIHKRQTPSASQQSASPAEEARRVITVEYSFTGEAPLCRVECASEVKFVKLSSKCSDLFNQLMCLAGSEYEGNGGYFDVYSRWRRLGSVGYQLRWMKVLELLSDRIGKLLIEPVLNTIEEFHGDRLALIPNGWMGSLPLQIARVGEDDWLIDRYELIQASSTESLRFLSCVAPAIGKAILVDGGGQDIPMTHSEISSIEKTFRKHDQRETLVLSDSVPIDDFFAILHNEDAAWLHLASHMNFNPYDASGTQIAVRSWASDLGAKGNIRTPELLKSLHKNFKRGGTVVLSGCESGCFDELLSRNGRETLSLANLCLFSGARNVIASSWAVDDLSACLLMQRFYQTLCDGRESVSGCLREAQRWLKQLPRDAAADQLKDLTNVSEAQSILQSQGDTLPFSHPLFWAGWYCAGAA
jgi:CHAT domain-containing protein/tetratricopeptide (TPR) repeat protein